MANRRDSEKKKCSGRARNGHPEPEHVVLCVFFIHFNYNTYVLLEVLFLSYDFTRCFYTPQPRCVQHNDDFYDVIMTYGDQNYDILECKCVILRSVYDMLDFI